MSRSKSDARLTPISGHSPKRRACPLCGTSGLYALQEGKALFDLTWVNCGYPARSLPVLHEPASASKRGAAQRDADSDGLGEGDALRLDAETLK